MKTMVIITTNSRILQLLSSKLIDLYNDGDDVFFIYNF